ncbi:MAG: response regulator [Chloroflexota bacterium]|nr:response regulator [Chloroflexota bacterium]MDE3194587.1 response regulator [Chloroflexota bacterium]
MADGASVLAVDDDPSILDLMTDILSGEGYRVLAAQNGAEALDVLVAEDPCVVLLDMRMPTLDGWGFAKALRDKGLRYPVVVVTAAENARAWAQEIGADAYLAKPFQLTELLRIVARFCPRDGGGGMDTPGLRFA